MPSDKPLLGCRILLVEDECFIAMEIDNLLTEAGAEIVGPIVDVAGAMGEARRDGLALAVLDVKIHGGLTYDIADELARQGIPFVFTTGYGKEAIPDRFGDVPCSIKPFDGPALVGELARLYAKTRHSQALSTSDQL